ncbi:hypothetical protein PHMEG_00020893, partial [Phytophthora megakarya]
MVPEVIAQVCKDYPHLDKQQLIATEGVRVEFTQDVPPQSWPPENHGSATERVNILRKNVRKKQDAGRCFVLNLDLLSMWPKVFISPFGIVDKAGGDPLTTGQTIHDLSFPEGASINDFTDQDAIPRATVMPLLTRFYGRIEIENALVFELACPFGWTGFPGEYEVIGGAVAFVHGKHGNRHNPIGFFNYHWVDDHVNVAADDVTNCQDMERSLRYTMTALLGREAVNEDKFTIWNTSQKILGLQFNSVAGTVAMPAVKIDKGPTMVASAYHSTSLSRKRSAMGMTIDNKRSLIRKSSETPGMTQPQLAAWARRSFRLSKAPARNTLSDILKNASAILKDEYGKGKRRKPLKVRAPRLKKGWEI